MWSCLAKAGAAKLVTVHFFDTKPAIRVVKRKNLWATAETRTTANRTRKESDRGRTPEPPFCGVAGTCQHLKTQLHYQA
jgi:hypothetical protein